MSDKNAKEKLAVKTIKEFFKKYEGKIIGLPHDIIKFVLKRTKNEKSIDYDKYYKNNKEDTELLNLTSMLFSDFWKNENNQSLKYIMIGPSAVRNAEGSNTIVSYLKNNKLQTENAYLYAIYCEEDKKFTWAYPDDLKYGCKMSIYSNMSFCKYGVLKNIFKGEADELALWYRVLVYYETNVLGIDRFKQNGMKTQNLVTFYEDMDNKRYKLYLLVDHGIKDPKLDSKIKSKFQTLENLVSNFKQSGPSKKKSHTSHQLPSRNMFDKLKN